MYLNYIKKYKMGYVPCFIIDNLDPLYTELCNKKISLQKKHSNSFRIIFVYLLSNPKSNNIILDYLNNSKEEKYEIKYSTYIFKGILDLPNKYEQCFQMIIPSITNYLKINNCQNEEEAKKNNKEEESEIEKEIIQFFNNDNNQIYLYINEIAIIVNKPLNIKSDFSKNIFQHTPLNLFDLEIIDENNFKIKYSSISVKNVINKICSKSIITLLPKLTIVNMENYIKGGIFERGVIELINDINPIFGKIEKKIEFDYILNYFKTKKDYQFTDNELNNKFRKLKSINKLKLNFKYFSFNNNVMITQCHNGKDWDLVLIKRDDINKELINLCLIQIGVNKNILQIQKIFTYFENKKKFILRKIKEILGVQVDNIHVLFILLKQTQNINTSIFLKNYNIPYIYYDLDTKSFIYENTDKVDYFHLNDLTSYITNEASWEKCLEFKINNLNIENDDDDDQEQKEEEEIEIDNMEITQKKNIGEIIVNKNVPLFD